MINVKATITGGEGLQKELEAEEGAIRAALPRALNEVGGEMAGHLMHFLQTVWYEGYTPKEYVRRTNDPSLGIGIMEMSNVRYSADGYSLAFDYLPSGSHAVQAWSARTGDELIESIQTGELAGKPPKRPFWNMFVRDLENGFVFETLKRSSFPYELVSEATKDVVFSSGESLLRE